MRFVRGGVPSGIGGAHALLVAILLLSYGAVGARQPAVRTAAPLPAPAAAIAATVGLGSDDRSSILLDIVRVVFDAPDGHDPADQRLHEALMKLLRAPQQSGETVPLPLDPSIWRDTVLERQVPDSQIITEILSKRQTALLYHGLAALDDETLAWLGPERDVLLHATRHVGAFAAFGRSIRVKAGRVAVPGEGEAEPVWEALVGASAGRPGAFVRRLLSLNGGRMAFFYDAIAHLDEGRQRFALAAGLPTAARIERVRALFNVFDEAATDLLIEARPFVRPALDAMLALSLIEVSASGHVVGPTERGIWDRVFREDNTLAPSFAPVGTDDLPRVPDVSIDAAWLMSRIHRDGLRAGRRRLDTFLFAQRVFSDRTESPAAVATALRGAAVFPMLLLTLERAGITAPSTMAAAAVRAQALNSIGNDERRRAAILQFQGAIGIIERTVRSGAVGRDAASRLVSSLVSIPVSERAYEGRLAAWLREELLTCLPEAAGESSHPLERALLSALAGVRAGGSPPAVVQWEGQAYQVNAAEAEVRRLRRTRERQGGSSLDQALAGFTPGANLGRAVSGGQGLHKAEIAMAETLTSILYATYLGDPESGALAGGNVALRHDLDAVKSTARRPFAAWRPPVEEFGRPSGWRISGSLLGLDVVLGRLALRRLDSGEMPPEPKLGALERSMIVMSAALMNPLALTDASRDEIAAALARGRARVRALTGDREETEKIAREAGLSEWRREAIAWTLAHDRERLLSQFSLVELLWLGTPRESGTVSLDAWGAVALSASGCLCLQMPAPRPWEHFAGRPSTGLLATRAADVALRVAETLAAAKLPAALAPGVLAFALQDVVDRARPSHFDDWPAFARATAQVTPERMTDYIAALTAVGPLLPVTNGHQRP